MNSMADNWVRVGRMEEIPLRGARRVEWGSVSIAIFRTASSAVYAIEDKCPHKSGPLSQGIVHDDCVTCPLHNWVISLENGRAQGADEGAVRTFRVHINEEAEILLCAEDLPIASEVSV